MYAANPAPSRTPLAFALLSSSSTSWFLILDGIGPLLLWSVGASGLSAGAAAAALELEAPPTLGVDLDLALDDDAAAAAEEACGTLDDDPDDLAADDAIEPPLIVVGTFSLSLDEIDTAADLAADLPLGCVIDLAGPGMTSTLWLGCLAFRDGGLRGTGMCADDDEVVGGDGVPFPIFTLIGATGVGGAAGFCFCLSWHSLRLYDWGWV